MPKDIPIGHVLYAVVGVYSVVFVVFFPTIALCSFAALGIGYFLGRKGKSVSFQATRTPTLISSSPDFSHNTQTDNRSLLEKVEQSVREFVPSKRYDHEEGYHAELTGWLKHDFPETRMEYRTGYSIPDIVIGDIAIEVKGPTGSRELDTLTSKFLSYTQHYPHLLVVLFEPTFTEGRFNEISRGVRLRFPEVRMIRKQNYYPYLNGAPWARK